MSMSHSRNLPELSSNVTLTIAFSVSRASGSLSSFIFLLPSSLPRVHARGLALNPGPPALVLPLSLPGRWGFLGSSASALYALGCGLCPASGSRSLVSLGWIRLAEEENPRQGLEGRPGVSRCQSDASLACSQSHKEESKPKWKPRPVS